MEKVLILSAGGTGRELRELLELSGRYAFEGFLDDFADSDHVAGQLRCLDEFLGQGIRLLSALGSYKTMVWRRALLHRIPLVDTLSFVAPAALVYPSARLGQADVIFPNTVVSSNAAVGNHCLLYHNCVVSHDVALGDYAVLANSAVISGHVTVGENTYLGANSSVLEGLTIGANSIVAAGATVTKDVPEESIYLSPRRVKKNHYLT